MKKYIKYIIELVVIVVGITLSFMVEEWRENSQKRQDVEKALNLMLKNLETDSIQLYDLNRHAINQESYLKLVLTNKESIHDSLLLDFFWASWTMRSQITIQKSALENLNGIQGLYYKTEGFQSILDYYYDFTALNIELVDWHLTNQRIDNFKWKELTSYNELVLILNDSIQDDYYQLQNNEFIQADLNNYFKDQELINLLADKYLMVHGVIDEVKYKMEEHEMLKKAILKEIKN